MSLAKQAGAKISFDSNLRLKLWSLDDAKQHMLPAIAGCDLFLPSWDDVTQISGLSDPAAIVQWSHDLGAQWVALKLGADGVLLSDGREQRRIESIRVTIACRQLTDIVSVRFKPTRYASKQCEIIYFERLKHIC